jgi:peptidoglycan/xylan/chitin deacetylase (PgdA/CDA1 family)
MRENHSVPARRSNLPSAVTGQTDITVQSTTIEPVTDVLVLAYHAVSDEWDAVTTVATHQLRSQVTHLLRRGYAGVTFAQALSAPPPGKVLAVTFDDAHRSVYETAFPLLAQLGIPATVFAPTDYIGTGEPTAWEGFEAAARGTHSDELVCMGWDELRAVADAGWEVGSHTCSHPHLPRLSPARVHSELLDSRKMLEDRLQRPCPSLAYPYSDVNMEVVGEAHKAGYSYAATVPVGSALSLPLRWSRVGVFRTDSPRRFRLTTSRVTRDFLANATGTTVANAVRTAKGHVRRLTNADRG